MDESAFIANAANNTPLSPISFLRNTARIYPQRLAVVCGERRQTYAEFYDYCARMAAALAKRGIARGDVVSFLAANTAELLAAHFAVPMAGGVLNAINTRLDAATVAYILQHAESKLLFVDDDFAATAKAAAEQMRAPPPFVAIAGGQAPKAGASAAALSVDELLAEAGDERLCHMPQDEWQPIALNYTSGTTGKPKGVVYHHRGAYLMALGSVAAWNMQKHETYLYTVPMFHCNGWGYPWTQTLLAGVFVCQRKVDGAEILAQIERHQVTRMGGAPIVLSLIAEAGRGKRLPHGVKIMTAGAPPPPSVLAAMEAMGFEVTHVYGLTETFGHTTICAWQEEWAALPAEERAQKQAQQGVGYPILQDWSVLDSAGKPTPQDGKTIGEIALRGNTIMRGYLKDKEATAAALRDGWFHTGDLAVWGKDNYLRVADRLKDIIISGGENISSIAVESALCKHEAVLLAAVVAKPDDKWGETPCAFLELRANAKEPTTEALTAFCREVLPGYMRPRFFVFGELPKTATGKIKKYELRERAKNMQGGGG